MDKPVLIVDKLTRSFETAAERLLILDELDLVVPEKNRIGILGDAGCGKSTLLKLLTGLLKPSSGHILWQGKPLGEPDASFYAGLFYLQQQSAENLFGLCPRHDLEIWQLLWPDILGQKLDKMLGTDLAARLDAPFNQLSSGEKRAFALLPLYFCPEKYWILDEPTASLDAARKGRFLELCRSKKGMLVASHETDLLLPAMDRVLHLRDGSITGEEI